MNISLPEYRFILRNDFPSFIERSFYELNPQTRLLMAPYIEVMATKLEACRQGKIRRLIINLPPRYLKSHCASVAFVAWLLGHRPSEQVICASYGQDLSDKLALDCRKLMSSQWYQALFPTRLAPEKHAVNDFMTTDLGFRMATSVGGVLTGRGANFIILDDPLKPDDAMSKPKRNAVNNWYDSTLVSRLNDKTRGCIIIIAQRLHQDDLVGHVLGLEDWEIVSFPAIAEADEEHIIESVLGNRVFKRKAGEVLHPERETLEMLDGMRKRIGSYHFSSQYQQNPVPAGGAMVQSKWLQYYDELPLSSGRPVILQSWDTANKSTELSDYSVCTTWRFHENRYYLLHVFRARLDYPDLKRAVIDQSNKFSPKTILIEDKSSGISLIQDLKASGISNIIPYNPPFGSDKEMRLHIQTVLFENGQVFLPRQVSWLQDYVYELTSFPGTKHDDQVDSTTQALDYLSSKEKAHQALIEMWIKLGKG